MKLRNLIIVSALIATIPFLLTFLVKERSEPKERDITAIEPIGGTEETSTPVQPETARSSSPKTKSPVSPDAVESPEEEQPDPLAQTSPPTGAGSPPEPADEPETVAGDPADEPETKPPAEPMTVGVVKEKAKLDPELADLAKRGVLAITEQRWEEAREVYLELVKKAPDNALAYANLGVAEHQLGNGLAAAGNLRKSLDINPGISRNWQTLGIIHFERGELEMAISTLTRAIAEDPSDARSRLYLAAVIREYGWTEAAITELERAIETDPELAEAHYNLAVTYLDSKPPRTELARRHYFSAIRLGAEPAPELEQHFSPKNSPLKAEPIQAEPVAPE